MHIEAEAYTSDRAPAPAENAPAENAPAEDAPAASPTLPNSAIERRRMERELKQAMQHGRLTLHYQSRHDLATGAMIAREAHLRWPDRRHGMVPPAQFLPVAERSELINLIGGWMLAEACANEACRPDPATPGPSLSVAVSPRQVQSGALLTQIGLALDRSGLAPHRLELELTEPVFIDGDIDTLLTLSAIRDLGIGLSLQGFGAGHVSLTMLKRLPLTTLKLHTTLIRDLPQDREDAAIVHATLRTAQAMDLMVVAEGIETEAQRAFLCGLQCQQGFGSLFNPQSLRH